MNGINQQTDRPVDTSIKDVKNPVYDHLRASHFGLGPGGWRCSLEYKRCLVRFGESGRPSIPPHEHGS